jgi:Glycosyl hydrolase family 26
MLFVTIRDLRAAKGKLVLMQLPRTWLVFQRRFGPVPTALFVITLFASGCPTTASATTPAASNSWQRPVATRAVVTPALASSATILSNTTFLPLIMVGSGVPTSSTHIYWGAMVNGQPPTTAAWQPGGAFNAFEASAGKKMAIVHWGQPWQMNGSDMPFQTAYYDNTRQHGSIPLVDWGSWALGGGPLQPDFRLTTITAGLHDAYIRQWATDAKAWGHPFFLRFDWEMDGNWQFPWSAQLNGNTPADYILAWRHVHDLFAQVGANNATWVWCPNISGGTTLPYASLYPGDAYVDWTCFDGYNKYDTWLGLNTIFTGSGINWLYDSYHKLLTLAPNKPIMIGETASLEAGDGGAKKAAWITDALTAQLPNHLPAIKAVVWFNWDANSPDSATLPIESSDASIAAFRSAIDSNTYLTNEFADINTSPIPPP